MDSNWQACLDFVWRPENDGQEEDSDVGEQFVTRWGITEDDWETALRRGVVSGRLRDATKAQCAQVLRRLHWDACNCDKMAMGCDLMVFNIAMLAGTGHATNTVQDLVDTAGTGFGIGPKTLLAIQGMGVKEFIDGMAAADKRFFHQCRRAVIDEKGWVRREDDAQRLAYQMARIDHAPGK